MRKHSELLPFFLTESIELLDIFDESLLTLEKNPANLELIHSIFRVVHGIRGMSLFLHMNTLEKLLMAGEELIGDFRSGAVTFDLSLTDLLLRFSKASRAVLVSMQSNGTEGPEQYSELINSLYAAHRATFGETSN
jgi:two-component system chemotaxis sensor kinase CheA